MKKAKWALLLAAVLIAAGILCWLGIANANRVSFVSVLPERPWQTMNWIRHEPGREDFDQGKCDPEELYNVLKEADVIPVDGEQTIQKACYQLFLGNPEQQPLQRYNICIYEHGLVYVGVQEADGIVEERYYHAGPELFEALDALYGAFDE